MNKLLLSVRSSKPISGNILRTANQSVIVLDYVPNCKIDFVTYENNQMYLWVKSDTFAVYPKCLDANNIQNLSARDPVKLV